MSSRRRKLASFKGGQSSHGGLWFDKFLLNQEDSKNTYPQLIDETIKIIQTQKAHYKLFYDRWLNSLIKIGVKPQVAHISSRVSIGLGNASTIETGVSLHRTYGVPFIPGSAIKGLTRHFATEHLSGPWGNDGDAFQTVFGSQESAGYITFYDALPDPDNFKMISEIMTVHHPHYYRGERSVPAAWDDPTPISFMAFTGNFLLALHSPAAPGWEQSVYGMVDMAFQEKGIGAKTSSGFGRARVSNPFCYFDVEETYKFRVTEVDSVGRYIFFELNESIPILGLPQDRSITFSYECKKEEISSFSVGQSRNMTIIDIQHEDSTTWAFCRPATKEEKSKRNKMR